MENKSVETIRKKRIVQALIRQIRQKDKKNRIKTNILEGFRQPEKIPAENEGNKEYIPDVVSENGDRLDIYEIELYEQNYVLEKWKKFSDYSAGANGSFNIVVPNSHLATIKDMLDTHEIPANIIYFTN